MSLKDLGEKIDGKLDKIEERLDSIDGTLIKQNKDLEHHIFRTELAEQNIEMLRIEFKPIQKRYEAVNVIFKIVGMFATGLGLIVGLAKVVTAIFFN